MRLVFLANPMQLQKEELIFLFVYLFICIDVAISAQAVEAGHVSYWFGPAFPWPVLSTNDGEGLSAGAGSKQGT